MYDTKLSPTKTGFITPYQAGFTLIELLIALVLGLLISAAVLQVYLTSTINAQSQAAISQIQDNTIFALNTFKKHLRRINFGAQATAGQGKFFMNHLTPQGGVVLTAPDGAATNQDGSPAADRWKAGNLYGLTLNGSAIEADLLSQSASANSSSNMAGTAVAQSDQLTIQYQAFEDGLFDCQGRAIPENYYVIERYFVRTDTTVTPNQNGLACASAIYNYTDKAGTAVGIDIKEFQHNGTTVANNLSGNGVIVLPNVDYFTVLLGVSKAKDFAVDPDDAKIAYVRIPSNPATTLNNYRIVSLQVGLLTHSDNAVSADINNADLRFNVLDRRNLQLNTGSVSGPKYLRNVYETTVLVRNARGGV